jgi:hypothetical protein
MSWDVFVQDIPADAVTVDDIASDFVPAPIGKRSEVIQKIMNVVPFADFSNPSWGTIDGEGFSIEVSMGEVEELGYFAFHASGDERAAAVIADILSYLNLRAFDTGTGDIFNSECAAEGLARWRQYRDSVMISKASE